MKLQHEGIEQVRKALHKRFFDVSDALNSPLFLDDVEQKAAAIYSRYNDDKRTLPEVYEDVLTGELGEYAVYKLLKEAKADVIYNEEDISKELWWDVCVLHGDEPLYGEVKFQGTGFGDEPKTTFGFNKKEKDQHMRDNWAKLSFIIAFYFKQNGDKLYVVPWLLIDSDVINPKVGLYGVSHWNDGYYLQMGKAQEANMFTRLNYDSNLFTFE